MSGIGTGGVSISGIGQLIDRELTGKPDKGDCNEYSHFAVKAERNGKVIDARVLHGDYTKELSGTALASHHHSWGYGQGLNRTTLAGLAHFPDVTFTGEFPFAGLEYHCDRMPADIRLKAFNPFIPNDADNSSLPAAFFHWEIKNTSDEPTDYTVAFSVGNPFRISDGGFRPVSEKLLPLNVFRSAGNAWGTALIGKASVAVTVLDGELTLKSFRLPSEAFADGVAKVSSDGKDVSFTVSGSGIVFDEKVSVRDKLVIG